MFDFVDNSIVSSFVKSAIWRTFGFGGLEDMETSSWLRMNVPLFNGHLTPNAFDGLGAYRASV